MDFSQERYLFLQAKAHVEAEQVKLIQEIKELKTQLERERELN